MLTKRRRVVAIASIAIGVSLLLTSLFVLLNIHSHRSGSPFLEDGIFRVSAHRGAQLFAPENTLEAVEEAIKHQYGAVELDPRRSLDGQIYLMHDDDVSRTTNGRGAIEEMHNQEIESLQIDTENYQGYNEATLKIPTLEQAVALLEGKNIVLNIDCSKGNWNDVAYFEKVIAILKKHDMLSWSFFVISNNQTREMVQERYPDLCISWLYSPQNMSINDYIEGSKRVTNPKLLSIKDEYATEEVLKQLFNSGVYFQVYSVTDEERKIELKELGVPMIETDNLLP